MKPLYTTIAITTLIVVVYVALAQISGFFPIIFISFLLAQGFLLYMVYRVLTDNYKTEKTFDDRYEDYPVKR